jgi:hypothetical protein
MAVLCCAGGAAVRGQRQRSHESQRFQSGRGPCALRLRHRAALAATYSTHAPSRAVTSSLLGLVLARPTVGLHFGQSRSGCYPGNPGTTSRVAESRSARSDCLRTRAYKFPASASRRRVIEDSLRRPLSSDTALSGSYLSTTGMLSSPAVTVLTIHGSSRTGSAAATAIMMGPSGCQVCQWGLEGSAAPNLQYSEYKIQAWRHVYVCIRVFVYTTASVTSATPRADTRFYRRSC